MFGKAFETRKEANAYLKKLIAKGEGSGTMAVRKMSKKDFPRRKKLYHVGTYLDFVNFA